MLCFNWSILLNTVFWLVPTSILMVTSCPGLAFWPSLQSPPNTSLVTLKTLMNTTRCSDWSSLNTVPWLVHTLQHHWVWSENREWSWLAPCQRVCLHNLTRNIFKHKLTVLNQNVSPRVGGTIIVIFSPAHCPSIPCSNPAITVPSPITKSALPLEY